MRIIVTLHPGQGHFFPMVPILKALQSKGHEIIVATSDMFKPIVEKKGFKHLKAGLEWDESHLEETLPEIKSLSKIQITDWLLKEVFLNRSPKMMVPDIIEFSKDWKPDLILREFTEFGGLIAAELLNIPCVCCDICFCVTPDLAKTRISKEWKSLRSYFNLKEDSNFEGLRANFNISLFPKDWKFPERLLNTYYIKCLLYTMIKGPYRTLRTLNLIIISILGVVLRLKPGEKMNQIHVKNSTFSQDPFDGKPPLWLKDLPEKNPTVFLALGTTFSKMFYNVFQLIIESFRDKPINLIVSFGNENADLERFKELPKNVHIEKYLSLSALGHVVSKSDIIICHSGSSSINYLLYGKPLIALPLSGDQPIIAQILKSYNVISLPHPKYMVFEKMPLSCPYVDTTKIDGDMIFEMVEDALRKKKLFKATKNFQNELNKLHDLEFAVSSVEQFADNWSRLKGV